MGLAVAVWAAGTLVQSDLTAHFTRGIWGGEHDGMLRSVD